MSKQSCVIATHRLTNEVLYLTLSLIRLRFMSAQRVNNRMNNNRKTQDSQYDNK